MSVPTTSAAESIRGEVALRTLYWRRLDDGHYLGVLPDGTAVRTATQIGLFSTLCCQARGAERGPLRLRFVEAGPAMEDAGRGTPDPVGLARR